MLVMAVPVFFSIMVVGVSNCVGKWVCHKVPGSGFNMLFRLAPSMD